MYLDRVRRSNGLTLDSPVVETGRKFLQNSVSPPSSVGVNFQHKHPPPSLEGSNFFGENPPSLYLFPPWCVIILKTFVNEKSAVNEPQKQQLSGFPAKVLLFLTLGQVVPRLVGKSWAIIFPLVEVELEKF